MISGYLVPLERIILGFLILYLFIMTIPGLISTGQAQTLCEMQLKEAGHLYNIGNFEEAIVLLTECLETEGVSKEEKLQAYRLLGLTYIAKDYLDLARNAVRKLLEMVPNYKADPIQDPPPFTKLIEEVKQEQPDKEITELEKTAGEQPMEKQEEIVEKEQSDVQEPLFPEPVEPMLTEEEKGGSRKWLYIGGGAVLAGGAAAVYFLTRNGETETQTQAFPSPPGRP